MHDSEHRNSNQIARFLGNVVYDHLKKKSKKKITQGYNPTEPPLLVNISP